LPKRQTRRRARKGPRPVLPVITPEDPQIEANAEALAEPEPAARVQVVPAAVATATAPERPAPGPVIRHITRDHRYVLTELRRIAATIFVVIGGLILTAVFMRWA